MSPARTRLVGLVDHEPTEGVVGLLHAKSLLIGNTETVLTAAGISAKAFLSITSSRFETLKQWKRQMIQ